MPNTRFRHPKTGRFASNKNLPRTPSGWTVRALNAAQSAVPFAAAYVADKVMKKGADKIMESAQKAIGSGKSPFLTPSKTSKRTRGSFHPRSGFSTGRYVGRFKKPRKNKKTYETKALSRGYHTTSEVYGSVSDADCVYISHSTLVTEPIIIGIMGALMRKLFKKAGISISAGEQILPTVDPITSGKFELRYSVYGVADAGISNYSYILLSTDTIDSIVNTTSTPTGFRVMRDHLNDMLRGSSNAFPWILALYALTPGPSGIDVPRVVASIDLSDEHFNINVQSKLVVQNRTAGADALSGQIGELDRLDNQPLKGYNYIFSHGEPRLRWTKVPGTPYGGTSSQFLFGNVLQSNGMRLIRASELQAEDKDFKEPPVPKYFQNCTKSSKIILQPGTMKTGFIKYTYKGTFHNLQKKLSHYVITLPASTINVSVNSLGRCQMISLEELLKTPTSNYIKVTYEKEVKVGVTVKTRKLQVLKTNVVDLAEYSNIQPPP